MPIATLYDLLTDAEPLIVIDVGASDNGGLPSYYKPATAPHTRVFAFEPNPAEYEKLKAAPQPGRTVLPYFVGDGKPGIYHETNRAITGSLYEPNAELMEKFQAIAEFTTLVAKHPTETMRLDDITEIEDVDFLKLDVQGGELDVMKHAGRHLSRAVAVQSEVEFVELYKGQPLYGDIDVFLRGAGFSFHTFHDLSARCFKPLRNKQDPYAGIRQIIWGDVIYVKDFMKLSLLPDKKLQKLAIIAHDIFGSLDLCHYVLQELDQRRQSHFADSYMERLR